MKILTPGSTLVDFILIPEQGDIFADKLGCRFMYHVPDKEPEVGVSEELFTDCSSEIFRYIADDVSDFGDYIDWYEEDGAIAVVDVENYVRDFIDEHSSEAAELPTDYTCFEWCCYFHTLDIWGFLDDNEVEQALEYTERNML